jgi:energy-coupling factor transporter ATP-binding protein EcfA2
MTIDSTNPYVGLRPFEVDESILFFGRTEQTLELLQKLHQHRFVAVVGSSGSGKSSLLKAGLIPALKAGYLLDDSDVWTIVITKPGQSPVYNLADALVKQLNPGSTEADTRLFVQRINEEGVDAIFKLIEPFRKQQHINFFFLIDQFEELFRFSIDTNDASKKDEANDFVNILLQLSANTELPVYVVFTMRSDFIGDCAQFYGLPEALNQSQYLVPKPTRAQLKNVIEGPATLYNGKISAAFTSQLLNDIQKVKDELPLLQHVLMRTWDYEMKINKSGEIDLDDYAAVGGIEKALSLHADEALAGLDDEGKKIARLLFQALTASDYGGRKIRKPVHISELIKLTGATSETVYKIINHFNDDKRCFLIINRSGNSNDPLIDISHESLIRQWNTLNTWADEEAGSAKIYLRLSEAAALNKEGKKDPISGTELQVALAWFKECSPSPTWAGRYNNSFNEAMLFLQVSKKAEEDRIEAAEEKARKALEEEVQRKNEKENALRAENELKVEKKNSRRKTWALVAVLILLLITVFAVIFAFNQNAKAEKQRIEALYQKEQAVQNLNEAKINENKASFDSLKYKQEKSLFDSLKNKLSPLEQAKITKIQQVQASQVVYIIDVFYLQDIISDSKPRAEKIVSALRSALPGYIVRLKMLSTEANARSGYGIKENLIRCETTETDIANKLAKIIEDSKISFRNQPRVQIIAYKTPNYLSIFVCNY